MRGVLLQALIVASTIAYATLAFRPGVSPTRLSQTQLSSQSFEGDLADELSTWLPEGFVRDKPKRKKPKTPIRVTSLAQLKECIREGYRVQDVDVRGDTAPGLQDGRVHPVVAALYKRRSENSLPGKRKEGDTMKIALAIEGGGMRGCVAAGMASCLAHLGLDDSVDVVYGSSAGTLVGAYMISKQLPYFGPEIYYDVLTSAGEQFIDAQAILRSCGLGLFDLRLQSLRSLFRDRMGKPVLNLDYLLTTIVQRIKPLDWNTFWSKQQSPATQPLKIVASGLLSRQSVVLSAENDNFKTAAELAECMKASMLLPGVTGEVVRLKGSQASGSNIKSSLWKEYPADLRSENGEMIPGSEPMSDALIFEPLPYRSAVKENCTHVLILRTRADDLSVTVKMGTMEKMIMSRFFGRKLGLPHFVSWMHNQYHKLVYAEDVLVLNEANRDFSTGTAPKLFCLALPKGIPEVKRLETSRQVIFDSVRQGFAAAYDNLVTDPALQGKGWDVARQVWPDSIMDSMPAHLVAGVAAAEKQENPGLDLKAVQDELTSGPVEALKLPVRKREALVRALRSLQHMLGMSSGKEQ